MLLYQLRNVKVLGILMEVYNPPPRNIILLIIETKVSINLWMLQTFFHKKWQNGCIKPLGGGGVQVVAVTSHLSGGS